jgi:hypothetical protein
MSDITHEVKAKTDEKMFHGWLLLQEGQAIFGSGVLGEHVDLRRSSL